MKSTEDFTNGAATSGEGFRIGHSDSKRSNSIDIVHMKRHMSLFNSVNVIVGSIIGSGIFISPKGIIAEAGSVGMSLVIWVVCGMFCMVGAYCFAELGCAIPKSGAEYAYMFEAFGPGVAFLRLWVEVVVVRPCTVAIVGLTFAYYVIEPFFPDCEQPDNAVRFLAATCVSEYRIEA